MNKSESKYFNTAVRMDEAFIELLNKKAFEYITVKEICEVSGVNRSTFYLHYETINDILLESAEYISNKFSSYFEKNNVNFDFIRTAPKEELIFITSEFLIPWLTFIRDNKILYYTVLKQFDSISYGVNMYEGVYHAVYEVMDRYSIPEQNRSYMIQFYFEGLNAIVKEWLKDDCCRSIDEIVQIIKECVRAR